MGMGGSFSGDKPPTKLISSLYNSGSDYDLETGERIDGICKHCEQWDAELIDGGCRDRECKDARMQKMVDDGTAVSITTELPNAKGGASTVIKRGGKRFVYER